MIVRLHLYTLVMKSDYRQLDNQARVKQAERNPNNHKRNALLFSVPNLKADNMKILLVTTANICKCINFMLRYYKDVY